MSVKIMPDGRHMVQYRILGKKSPVKEYFPRGPAGKQAAEIRDAEIKLTRAKKHRVVRTTGVYLCDLAQLYLDHLKAQGKTDRFRHELANLLNNHFLPLLCDRPVEHLDFTDIMRVAEKYADHALATRNRYMDYLRAIFRFGVDQEITTNNPMKRWKKTKEPRRSVYLTVDDLKRIYEHSEPHLQWGIECEWHLGTRPGVSELLTVKWSDVDFENSTIHVRGTKTATSDRIVHVNPSFRARLLEMRDQATTEYLIEYKGKPLKKFRRSFKTACRRAGITYDTRMYDVRHLYISTQLTGGADLKAISEMVGHSSTKMTADVYYHCQAGEKARAASLVPSLRPPEEKKGKVVRIR